MDPPEIEHTRQLATAYELGPLVTLQEIADTIVSRTSITGGTVESACVLEIVTVAISEPAWSALATQKSIPTNTVTGIIAAVDQHKPAIPAANLVEVVIRDIRQALASPRKA